MNTELLIFLAFVAAILAVLGYKLGPKGREHVADTIGGIANELTDPEAFKANRWGQHISIGSAIGFCGVLIFGHWFEMFSVYEPWWFHIYVLALTGLVGSAFWEGGQAIKQGHFQDRMASFKAWGDIIVTTAAITLSGAIACALFIWVA